MASIKHYIQAARLRTLPLSLSGIIVGSGIAASEGSFSILVFILALLTTIGFQVISNFANDYGDGIKGTDDNRVGEQRLIAAGLITPKEMKRAIVIAIVITLSFTIGLILTAFVLSDLPNVLLFLGLGIISVIAAIKYTVGNSAYGYTGFGDVFVFLFFGLISVVGSYYLHTHTILNTIIFLPAIAMGLLSTAVLNLNNMRDQIADKKAKKYTLVVKMGSQWAKIYHYALLLIAFIALAAYTLQLPSSNYKWLYLLAFVPLIHNGVVVAKTILFSELDKELKKVALATFLCAILLSIHQFI